jgi:hypothetical protein
VLPSTIGGDAARIWLMARERGWMADGKLFSATRPVVGVMVLAILVVVCLPWTLDLIHDPVASATLAMIGFGTLAGAMGFLTLGVPLARHGKVVAHPPTRCRLALGSCVDRSAPAPWPRRCHSRCKGLR